MLHLACTPQGSDVRHLRQHAALQRLSPSRYHEGSFKPQSSHAEVTTCKQGATVQVAEEDASQTVCPGPPAQGRQIVSKTLVR